MSLKFDTGSKTTGFAIVREAPVDDTTKVAANDVVLAKGEIVHRGDKVAKAMTSRRSLRRNRRNRKTRYRAPRFDNRRRPDGLTPSMRSRIDNDVTWTNRLIALCPISRSSPRQPPSTRRNFRTPMFPASATSGDALRHDRSRLCARTRRRRLCLLRRAQAEDDARPRHPKIQGRINRPSNLVWACEDCNMAKDNLPVAEFLAGDSARLKKIQAKLKAQLARAAHMSIMRGFILRALQALGAPVIETDGATTAFNRERLDVAKSHANDAALAASQGDVYGLKCPSLQITATGRGLRQRSLVDAYGFPRGQRPRAKYVSVRIGEQNAKFQTGDIVRARRSPRQENRNLSRPRRGSQQRIFQHKQA